MNDKIKRAVARHLGLVTQAEAEAVALELVRKNVADFRGRVYPVTQRLSDERLALFKENTELRDKLGEALEEIDFLKEKISQMNAVAHPSIIRAGDF
jgi:hypothetical protein